MNEMDYIIRFKPGGREREGERERGDGERESESESEIIMNIYIYILFVLSTTYIDLCRRACHGSEC
jgi:hypothetical protein